MVVAPKNLTGPPSVVRVTESTFTSQYVLLVVKFTSMQGLTLVFFSAQL